MFAFESLNLPEVMVLGRPHHEDDAAHSDLPPPLLSAPGGAAVALGQLLEGLVAASVDLNVLWKKCEKYLSFPFCFKNLYCLWK